MCLKDTVLWSQDRQWISVNKTDQKHPYGYNQSIFDKGMHIQWRKGYL